MKRIIYTVVATAAILTGGVAAAAPALAGTGPNSNGQTALLTGKDAAQYTDGFFGPVRCNETQHPKFDTVSCTSTTGQPLTNVVPGETGPLPWASDFNGAGGTLTFTVSSDGLSYSGKATYGP